MHIVERYYRPLALPRAVIEPTKVLDFQMIERVNPRAFPDAGPEDVPIVDVHHDPLAVERVFENGSIEKVSMRNSAARDNVHVATGIVRRDVSAFRNVVLCRVV